MNKEQLEKMFDEEIKSITMDYDDNGNPLLYNPNNTLKQFIFDTIIPEVLNSILGLDEGSGYYDIHLTNAIKREAKELYGIEL